MLSGAPPMLVVGLVLQALWVPLAVVMRATNTRLGLDAFALSLVLFFVGNFMVMLGALELARRSRGRARDGAALAVVADAIVLVIGVLATLKQGGWMPGDRHWVLDLGQWGAPLAALVGILGFAIAAGLRHALVSLYAFAATAVLFPIPPISRLVAEHLVVGGDGLFVVYGLLMCGRSIALARLGVTIAKDAYPVTRDHVRAARGLRWTAIGAGLRASTACAILAFVLGGGNVDSKPAMMITALEIVAMVSMVKACWATAQAQLDPLPRYLVHVALASAMTTLVGMVRTQMDVYTGVHDVMYVPRWVELAGTLTVGWMVVVIGLYARRARTLVRPAQIWGGLFTLVACLGVAFGTSVLATMMAIASNVVVIPLFVLASREVANDPVKTTADVFA